MSTEVAAVPIMRERGEGERRWFFGGGIHEWKLTTQDTGGAFFLFEDLLEEGKVTPLHHHPDAAETIYVLEGSLLVHLDGKQRELGAGGVVMFPRGVPHALRVTSKTARLLCLQTPGSGESFYRLASEPMGGAETVDFRRLGEAAKQSGGVELLGPPPFGR